MFIVLTLLIFNFNLAGTIKFINKNQKFNFTEYKIKENSYISLNELSNKLNFKVSYNRSLHKLSFNYKGSTILLSPILEAVNFNGANYFYKNSLKFFDGKFYVSTPLMKEKLAAVLDLKLFKNTFLIDAGHGGLDLGATVTYKNKKIFEKDIVLNFTLLLKELLEAKGYEVILTRAKDEKVELKQRIDKSNFENALAFVSIHANFSETNSDAKGLEVYYLSEKAGDANSNLVANFENNVFLKNKSTNDDNVDNILKSMFLSSHIAESTKLAYSISTQIRGTSNRGVKKAPFYVLAGTSMPSVLIELGFMSNEEDLKNLLNKNWNMDMGKLIAEGIAVYLDNLVRSKEDEV